MACSGTRRTWILVLPAFHALDFAGPVQTLYEARGFGAGYDLHFVSTAATVRSAQGFAICDVEPLPEVSEQDWILVPGIDSSGLDDLAPPVDWLRGAARAGARVASICSGAFALARSGLLDRRRCTTHWKLISELERAAPTADVLENRLYVRDGQIVTSAGVASGIDMTLDLVEEDHGPELTARVAREMVVYLRRHGSSSQSSVYLEHRAHMHPGVHRVQDWIVAHANERATLEQLADVAAMSPRHLTRVFRETTGITVKAFDRRVKLEVASTLMTDSSLRVEEIATRCGFRDARQFRRVWRQHFGSSPSETRQNA